MGIQAIWTQFVLPKNCYPLLRRSKSGAIVNYFPLKQLQFKGTFLVHYFIGREFLPFRYTVAKFKYDSHAIRKNNILYSCYGIHSLFVLLFIGYANALCFAIKRELMSQQERCDCHQQYFSQLKYHLSV